MSTLLIGLQAQPYKQSDPLDKVRSTVTTVTDDAPSMATGTPELNNLETDPNTDGGLTPHQVAAKRTGSERYVPATVSRGDHNAIVNDRISSVGTAAAREAAGEWGHGTLSYQDSLTRPEDTPFSETYFMRDPRGANATAGAYMTPATTADPEALDAISDSSVVRAKETPHENPYNAMYRNLMEGVK